MHNSSRRAACAFMIVVLGALVACTPGGTGQVDWRSFALSGWQPVSSRTTNALTGGQGLATVHPAVGASFQVFEGLSSVPPSKSNAGWTHVGDPGAHDGILVLPYESADAAQGKLFTVIAPDGSATDYPHPLVPGEEHNNSFADVSPDGQWLVSGEWDTMSRLLVFPMPGLNPAAPAPGGALPLATTIALDHPVRDVQGCTFVSSTRLLCASDDPDPDFQPTAKPLLQVDLARPLDGAPVTGAVTSLGHLPVVSICTGDFEVEGLDYDAVTQTLSVVVIPPIPCAITADVYDYRPA